jgi:drug/metabolite transporter (DMT)-like permease
MKVVVWLLLAVIWGTTWIFIKIGLDGLPPMTFAASRFILAVIILLPIVVIRRFPIPRTRSQLGLLALTGFLQFSLNYSAVFWSEQYIASGLAAVLQATITVFGLVLAWIFLPDERITGRKVFAVVLGVAGVGVIFIDQLRIESWLAFMGCLAVVGGSYAAAQASILIKAKGHGLHPASMLLVQMICGLPAVIAYSVIVEGNPLRHEWSWTSVICILYLTVLGTIAAFWLYYWLLKRVESTKAMMISLVTPLLAVVIGAITIGETLPPQTFVGGLMIVGSVGLIALRRTPHVRENT